MLTTDTGIETGTPTPQSPGGTVGVGQGAPSSPLSPAAPPNDTNPSVLVSASSGDTQTSSSVLQTVADLISQGLNPPGASSGSAGTPTVVPVSGGGGISLLPILLLAGAGFGLWYFMKHKKKAAE